MSFNGGKDCNVLLHLLHLFLAQRQVADGVGALLCLTWLSDDVFPEVEENMRECERVYGLRVEELHGSFKDGLARARNERGLRAIFMGQRRTDPHAGELDAFAMTSPGWPEVVRVNPLLEWSYEDIWHFTRLERVPVCTLYRRGFTSLGARDRTTPNPHLRIELAAGDGREQRTAAASAVGQRRVE